MDRWTSDYEAHRWKQDINSYYRWKALRDVCTNEFTRKACQDNMDRIRKEHQQFRQAFED